MREETKTINESYNDIVNALIQTNLYVVELQERIIEARKYLLKNIEEEGLGYWQRSELFKILGDKEQEEYILTKDEENGTTNINGEWYRVEKK